MNNYYPLTNSECLKIIHKIVLDFGDGNFNRDKYVFDQIKRLPRNFVEKRVSQIALVDFLKVHNKVCVVFDPIASSKMFLRPLLISLNIDEDTCGVTTHPSNLLPFLSEQDSDFYVTTTGGDLLSVACHEDNWKGNLRFMWCPVRQTELDAPTN